MMPSISRGSNLFVLHKQWFRPQRGDIVLLSHESQHLKLVCRILGLSGEEFTLVDQDIYINQKRLEEPFNSIKSKKKLPSYISQRDNLNSPKIDESHYYCLTDNRKFLIDSRVWGAFPAESIKGKIVFQ